MVINGVPSSQSHNKSHHKFNNGPHHECKRREYHTPYFGSNQVLLLEMVEYKTINSRV